MSFVPPPPSPSWPRGRSWALLSAEITQIISNVLSGHKQKRRTRDLIHAVTSEDRQERRERALLLRSFPPPRLPAPKGWGPSRVGEMRTNFSKRNLTQVDRGPCKKPQNCAITLLSTLPWLQQELDLENLPLFADSDSPHPLSHPIPTA